MTCVGVAERYGCEWLEDPMDGTPRPPVMLYMKSFALTGGRPYNNHLQGINILINFGYVPGQRS